MKKIFALTKDQLEALPPEVIEQVEDTLKAFDSVTVDFENGRYHVFTGCGISAHYADDHKFIGIAYADDIYTREERRASYKESFGYDEFR